MTVVLSAVQAPAPLPLAVTSFVGRRHDRIHVRRLMESSRLVTLTGFGGIGKTRLALRVAQDVRRTFPDGVNFVSLGELHRADAVADQIAAALGLDGRAKHTASFAVVEYLRDRSSLLILDNCEHVIDVAAEISDELLHRCPGVRLLTTSREPLRIDGEVVYAVGPLTPPDEQGHEAPDPSTSEAEQLFLERARAAVPDFELTNANRDSVAAICRKVEGIPLALELAAARLRALSPAELDNELAEHWEVLSRGARTAPHRQTTMAACIDWSFNLCTPSEQTLWARAAVFIDGFELDAASAVCSESGDGNNVRDLLSSLVEKSVLTVTRQGDASRFWMLPPIRQRGVHELSAHGKSLETRRRHRDFYVDMLAHVQEQWLTTRQLEWIQRLRRELGNLREALDFCTTVPGEADAGIRAMEHMLGLAALEGLLRQCRHWSESLLELGDGNPQARALAFRTACWWAAMQGDVDAASSHLERAQALATGDSGRTQHMLTQAGGVLAMFNGDVERADQLMVEALQGFEACEDLIEVAHTNFLLALNRTFRGDVEGALGCHKRCLEITEPSGELWLRSGSMWAAGLALWSRGDAQEAEELLRHSLKLRRQTSERLGIALTLEALAWLAAETDPERTVVLVAAAQNEWERLETSTAAMPGLDLQHQHAMSTARALLSEEGASDAWARGQAMSRSDAIGFALGEGSPAVKRGAGKKRRGGQGPLTRRERQIATLVYQGLSNREIAESLVISPRTAETHVENILSKLGFSSRTQIAAWVAEYPTEE